MLRTDSIYVWRVKLDTASGLPAATLSYWRSLLSEPELRKAEAFHHTEHRLDYITAHVALRAVLAHSIGISPIEVQFANQPGEGAKPKLAFGSSATDLRFNLSHTKGFALIGIAVGREIGIDVEWQRPMDDLEAMVRTVMSGVELDRWRDLKEEQQAPAFYNLWTRKEAYLKAIGLGLYRSLQDVTVPVSAQVMDSLKESSQVEDCSGGGHWRVTDIPVPGSYSASVCWSGDIVPGNTVQDLVREGAEWLP